MADESPDPGITAPAAAPRVAVPTDAPGVAAPAAPAPAAPIESEAGSTADRCPWCSAELAPGGLAGCPNCGAHLSGGNDPAVPGLTQVAPVALKHSVSAEPVRRSRLLAWISGEVLDDTPESKAVIDALAPPGPDVRREIHRLELEAAGVVIPDEHLPADAAPEAPTSAADRESTAA